MIVEHPPRSTALNNRQQQIRCKDTVTALSSQYLDCRLCGHSRLVGGYSILNSTLNSVEFLDLETSFQVRISANSQVLETEDSRATVRGVSTLRPFLRRSRRQRLRPGRQSGASPLGRIVGVPSLSGRACGPRNLMKMSQSCCQNGGGWEQRDRSHNG